MSLFDPPTEMVPDTSSFFLKRSLASKDCGDVGLGIDDAVAGETVEAARKVACPLFSSLHGLTFSQDDLEVSQILWQVGPH